MLASFGKKGIKRLTGVIFNEDSPGNERYVLDIVQRNSDGEIVDGTSLEWPTGEDALLKDKTLTDLVTNTILNEGTESERRALDVVMRDEDGNILGGENPQKTVLIGLVATEQIDENTTLTGDVYTLVGDYGDSVDILIDNKDDTNVLTVDIGGLLIRVNPSRSFTYSFNTPTGLDFSNNTSTEFDIIIGG